MDFKKALNLLGGRSFITFPLILNSHETGKPNNNVSD